MQCPLSSPPIVMAYALFRPATPSPLNEEPTVRIALTVATRSMIAANFSTLSEGSQIRRDGRGRPRYEGGGPERRG
jgi:hypothetical protein